jgi:phage shock protein C
MNKEYKRLYRSRRDKVFGGVCGGLGGYLGVDPVIIRIVWLATILIGGTGVLAYIIAWIIIPEASYDSDQGPVERETESGKIVGIILVVIALLLIAKEFSFYYCFFDIPWGWFGIFAILLLGVAIIFRGRIQDAVESRMKKSEPEAPVDVESKETPTEEKAEKSSDDTDSDKKEGDESDPFQSRPLQRSKYDRVILGVCGGLAKKYKMDSILMRLIWIFLGCITFGFMLIAYLILALMMPDEMEA